MDPRRPVVGFDHRTLGEGAFVRGVVHRGGLALEQRVPLVDVVVVPGEGVVDARAPVPFETLLQLQPQRVVERLAGAHMPGQHIPEMRVGPQQLAVGQRFLLREGAEALVAVEGVGDRGVQRLPAERERRIRQLVDVDDGVLGAADPQVRAAAAHIADLRHQHLAELPLEVERPLLDVGGGPELLVEEDIGADVLETAAAIPHRVADAVREGIRGRRLRRGHTVETGRHIRDFAVPVGAQAAGVGIQGDGVRRPEHRVAAADHRLVVRRPGETDPGAELHRRRIPLVGRIAVHSGVEQPAAEGETGERAGLESGGRGHLHRERVLPVPADGELVVVLLEAGLPLDAQPEVQHQVVGRVPVVLDETAEVVYEDLGRAGEGELAAGRDPEQQVGERVAGALGGGQRIRPLGEVLLETEDQAVAVLGGVESHPPPLTAELQRVAAPVGGIGAADLARSPVHIGVRPAAVGAAAVAVVVHEDQRELAGVILVGVQLVHEVAAHSQFVAKPVGAVRRAHIGIVEVGLPVPQGEHRGLGGQESGVQRSRVHHPLQDDGARPEHRRLVHIQQVRVVLESPVRGLVVHVGPGGLDAVREGMVQVSGEHHRRDRLQPRSGMVARGPERGEHVRQGGAGGVYPVGGNHIPRKRSAVAVRVQVERVVDRASGGRKVAGDLGGAGQCHRGVAEQFVVVALAGDEEEGAVAPDRPAEGTGAQVEGRFHQVGLGDVAAVEFALLEECQFPPGGVQLAGPRLEERAPGPGVRAAAMDHIEHAAAGAPHLGVVGVRLHLHLLDRLERRDDDGAVAEIGDGDAVHGVVVAAQRPAAERQQRGVRLVRGLHPDRIPGMDHIRRAHGHDEDIPARRGKDLELLPVHRRSHRSARRLDERRLGGHRDRLFDTPDGQLDFDDHERGDADDETFLDEGSETAQLGAQVVGPGAEMVETELPDRGGNRRSRGAGLPVGQGDGDAGHDAPVGVPDVPVHPALEGLRPGARRADETGRERETGQERRRARRSPGTDDGHSPVLLEEPAALPERRHRHEK